MSIIDQSGGDALKLNRPISTYFGIGFVALVIFIIAILQGLVTAIAPSLMGRLVLISIISLVLIIAVMGRNDKPVCEKFLTIWLVLLVFVLACWPSYLFFTFHGLPSFDARKLMAGGSLIALFYLVVNRRQLLKPILSNEGRPLRVGLWLLTTFVSWRLASCFVTGYPIASVILVLGEIINYYALFIIGMLIFNGVMLRQRFMISFMLAAIFIFLYVMVEWETEYNWLLNIAPRHENFAAFNVMLELSRFRGDFFRAQGTFEHPLVLAEFTAMAASFALATLLWKGSSGIKLLGSLVLLLSFVAAWMSGSRIAFIAIGAGLLIVSLLWLSHVRKPQSSKVRLYRKLFVIFAVISSVIAAVPTLILIAEGKSLSENASTQGRLIMLDRGIPSIMENPIFGSGPGYAGGIAGIKGGAGIGTLDNHLLAIAIESGVFSLLLFLALLIYPVWRTLVYLTEKIGTEGALLAGGAGALVAFCIVRTILMIPYNQSFAFLIAGMLLSATTVAVPKNVAKE